MEKFNNGALVASMKKKGWSYQRVSTVTMLIGGEKYVSLDTCKAILQGKRDNPFVSTVILLCAALNVRVADCFIKQ